MDHVVGFTVANDVSARDWQMRRNGRQWLLGKTFDTFCPLGPALVTKEAVAGEDGTGWGWDRSYFLANTGGSRHHVCPKAPMFVATGVFRVAGVPRHCPHVPPIA